LSPKPGHAVQQAWIAEDVPQCGYCHRPDHAAAALLAKNPSPSDATSTRHDEHLPLRTYQRIRAPFTRGEGA